MLDTMAIALILTLCAIRAEQLRDDADTAKRLYISVYSADSELKIDAASHLSLLAEMHSSIQPALAAWAIMEEL